MRTIFERVEALYRGQLEAKDETIAELRRRAEEAERERDQSRAGVVYSAPPASPAGAYRAEDVNGVGRLATALAAPVAGPHAAESGMNGHEGALLPSQVAATLEALRRGDWGSLTLERFTCFARFPKWTAARYALHWEISEDTAGRDLKDL
jgi:hypothetical protein